MSSDTNSSAVRVLFVLRHYCGVYSKSHRSNSSSVQNIVEICNQVTIFYKASSMLVHSSYTCSCRLIYLCLVLIRHYFLDIPSLLSKVLLVLHLTLFRLSPFVWLGFCNHCSLAYFLWSDNFEHYSLNHGLCCFSL